MAISENVTKPFNSKGPLVNSARSTLNSSLFPNAT